MIAERAGGAVAPRAVRRDMCARARAASCRQAASLRSRGRGHFGEREIEHVVQQEGSALERRQPVERQEQRYGQILGQFRCGVSGRERGLLRTARQPWTERTPRAARARGQDVESKSVVVVMRNALGSDTLSRSAACQRKYASCTASSASASTEHAVCETQEAAAVWLEGCGRIRHWICGAHGVRRQIR